MLAGREPPREEAEKAEVVVAVVLHELLNAIIRRLLLPLRALAEGIATSAEDLDKDQAALVEGDLQTFLTLKTFRRMRKAST